MRLAFLNYYQKGVNRGLETFVEQLSSRLFDHQTLVLAGPSDVQASVTPLNLPRRLFLDRKSRQIAAWTLSVLPRLSKFDPDLVLALNGGWQALIIRFWTCLKGKKLVLVGQSGPGWDDRWNLFCHPDAFVCLTPSQLAWAQKTSFCPRQRFEVIPNGVDLKKFTPHGQPADLNLERPIILCVAASQPYKRVGETIKAVSALKKGSLLLLGQGPQDEKINNLGQSLLGKNRFLHRTTSHNNIPSYYRSADLFTLVSESSEAFGIVYLEALACGLPVVATDDQTRRQIIGSAGLYVNDPTDTAAYTRKLRSALQKDWRDLPQKQARKFSWDKIAQDYQQLFRSL